jgi:hypothetical protein
MSYTPHWTNQDGNGQVSAGQFIRAVDVNELESAIDRRLKAMFDPGSPGCPWPLDFAVAPGAAIASSTRTAMRTGFDALLPYGQYLVHDAGWEQLSMHCRWLYPVSGADEDKIIVRDSKPPVEGEVGFFAKLNGGVGWTSGPGEVAAVCINEPRGAAAMLSRGRYLFRAGDGGSAKASRALPGGLWYPPAVARDGADELHSWFGGRQWLWPSDGTEGWFGPRGQDLAVRSATMRLLPQGGDARIRLYHCLRNVNAADFSWTEYDAQAELSWASPGGDGSGDAEHIADFALLDNQWITHDLTDLAADMFAGQAEPTFMIAPDEQTGWPDEPTHVQVELVIDFDLDCPPA